MRQEFRTTCNRDCPDSCGIIVTVEDGRVVHQRGDPDHGVTRGVLCSRGNEYLRRMYDPARIVRPRRRTRGGWEELSWDAALDLVAEQLRRARDADGPLSVLAASYSGIHTWVARVLWRRFWAHFGGATMVRGGLSVEAVAAAQELDFGGDATHEPEDLVHSRAFVVWGKNIAITRQHWMPFVKEARKRGATLAVIDPVATATARLADRHYQLRPGTDGVLALGVARLLIEKGALDSRFIAAHTQGFEAFRRLALSRTIDEVARLTDLAPAAIGELADLYTTKRPLATLVGLGPSYWESGAAQVRCIDALAALTGNVGVSGGGANSDIGRDAGLDLTVLRGLPKGERRTVLLPRLGEEVLAAAKPPLRMAFIAGANPASMAPHTARVREALRSLEFVVVVDQFMTATAEEAHLILPCTTFLEMDDLVSAYGHNWLGVTRRVVTPAGEARTDGEILQGLAQRLGFGAALEGSADTWLERLLAPLARRGVTLAALRERPRRRPNAVAVPFADRDFKTASGKVELVWALELPAPMPQGSLRLVATKSLHLVNSQVQAEHLPAEPVARLHGDTLRALALTDGAFAWVESATARVKVRVCEDPTVRRDVLLLNPTLWKGDLSGVNQLREARLTDAGEGAAMHETSVRLTPA